MEWKYVRFAVGGGADLPKGCNNETNFEKIFRNVK